MKKSLHFIHQTAFRKLTWTVCNCQQFLWFECIFYKYYIHSNIPTHTIRPTSYYHHTLLLLPTTATAVANAAATTTAATTATAVATAATTTTTDDAANSLLPPLLMSLHYLGKSSVISMNVFCVDSAASGADSCTSSRWSGGNSVCTNSLVPGRRIRWANIVLQISIFSVSGLLPLIDISWTHWVVASWQSNVFKRRFQSIVTFYTGNCITCM